MYAISRLLLILVVAEGVYCGAIFAALLWPWSGLAMAAAAYACATNKKRRLTSLGSARWAEADDLRSKKMLYADEGLIVGELQ